MADVEVSYKGSTIGSLSATGSLTLETEGKYCEADIGISYTKPSGGGGNFTLIGTKVFSNVSEWTDTSAYDTMDTEIGIKNTDYAWGYVVITCDTAILTSTEWGMSVAFWGRYTTNGAVYATGNAMQKGAATLSKAAMASSTAGSSSYGVVLKSNTNTIQIQRKCHTSACPKCRAGNYTVKVYGMTGL